METLMNQHQYGDERNEPAQGLRTGACSWDLSQRPTISMVDTHNNGFIDTGNNGGQ